MASPQPHDPEAVRGAAAPVSPSIDPSRWLHAHGDVLWRFAMSRARSAHEAEEAIQDTFEAALRARDGFRGESSERTWLLAILRRRLADSARSRMRERARTSGPTD